MTMQSRTPNSNASSWTGEIVDHRSPLQPIPTSYSADLKKLDGIKAVIFDVYGTLVVSGSGDVGSADQSKSSDHVAAAFEAVGLTGTDQPLPTMQQLREIIRLENDSHRTDDRPCPEVNIVAIWQKLLTESNLAHRSQEIEKVVRLATAYEARANPTWPMPNAGELIGRLSGEGLKLGIVSNAQIFTPQLVADLCGASRFEKTPFDLDLCFFSNRFRQSKPATRMFDSLQRELSSIGILPSQAIYVGNDMLNDVYAASQAGLKTAWFAGDRRSCRPRSSEKRCDGLTPDVTLTDLSELLDCLLD